MQAIDTFMLSIFYCFYESILHIVTDIICKSKHSLANIHSPMQVTNKIKTVTIKTIRYSLVTASIHH